MRFHVMHGAASWLALFGWMLTPTVRRIWTSRDCRVCKCAASSLGYLPTRCGVTNPLGIYMMCIPPGTYLVAPMNQPAGMTPIQRVQTAGDDAGRPTTDGKLRLSPVTRLVFRSVSLRNTEDAQQKYQRRSLIG